MSELTFTDSEATQAERLGMAIGDLFKTQGTSPRGALLGLACSFAAMVGVLDIPAPPAFVLNVVLSAEQEKPGEATTEEAAA